MSPNVTVVKVSRLEQLKQDSSNYKALKRKVKGLIKLLEEQDGSVSSASE